MMDLQTLIAVNSEIAEDAQERGVEPIVFDTDQIENGDIRDIPNIGPFLPDGWNRVNIRERFAHNRAVYDGDNDGFGAYFVDKSGFSGDEEPAMSQDQLKLRLQPGYGYAIVQEGQFQVKVGVFEQV